MPMSCSTCAHGKAPYDTCDLPELAAYVAQTGSQSFCARWHSARPLDATAYPHASPVRLDQITKVNLDRPYYLGVIETPEGTEVVEFKP